MAEVIAYLTLIGKRIYRPVRPALQPLLQLIKVWHFLAIIILLELAAIFWPLSSAIVIKNNLAAWPWSKSAQSSTEFVLGQPAVIAGKISAWEKFLTEKNESRDVFLNLAILSYQLYRDDQSRLFWERAFYLDPELVSSLPRPPKL